MSASEYLATGVIAITAGDLHTCVLVTGGGVDCWGYNSYGQLGTGDTTNRLIPTAVKGLGAGVRCVNIGIACLFVCVCVCVPDSD